MRTTRTDGCQAPGWGHGRTTAQCQLTATHRLRFPFGQEAAVCPERAAEAERRVIDAVLLPLE